MIKNFVPVVVQCTLKIVFGVKQMVMIDGRGTESDSCPTAMEFLTVRARHINAITLTYIYICLDPLKSK